jgi:hypothetical protein
LWSCCCVQPTHTDVGQSGLSRCVRSSYGRDRKPHGACRMLYIACFHDRPGAPPMSRCAHALPALRLQCTLVALPHSLRSYLLRLVTKLPSARTKLEVRRESLATTAESHCGLHKTATGNMQRGYRACSRVLTGTHGYRVIDGLRTESSVVSVGAIIRGIGCSRCELLF